MRNRKSMKKTLEQLVDENGDRLAWSWVEKDRMGGTDKVGYIVEKIDFNYFDCNYIISHFYNELKNKVAYRCYTSDEPLFNFSPHFFIMVDSFVCFSFHAWINILNKIKFPCSVLQQFADSTEKRFTNDFFKEDFWGVVSSQQNISSDFVERNKDYIDWSIMALREDLTKDFIKTWKNYFDWFNISYYQTLSESFIREFENFVTWYWISECQALSESLIKEYKNYVNWKKVSKYQNLSENFIEEFKDYVDWNRIIEYQHLSKKFIKKHKLLIKEQTKNEKEETLNIIQYEN